MKFWKNNIIPKSDYYAVIFCSTKSHNLDGYQKMDEKMMNMAMQQDGFLGYESAGDKDSGIFISYWENKESIEKWRKNTSHQEAKKLGMEKWYNRFLSQICKVEHSHHFER